MTDESDNLIRRLSEMIESAQAQVREQRPRPPKFESAQIEEAIRRLNKRYAVALVGDKFRILLETTDESDCPDLRFLKVEDFAKWEGVERFWNGGPQRTSIGVIYPTHPSRRQYDGITFAPQGAPKRLYNMFRGWAVDPSDVGLEVGCPTFKHHLLQNVCGGDLGHFDYLMSWLAQLVQDPAKPPGIAVVLRGDEGVGKTIVGQFMARILGAAYKLVDQPRHLTGNFNAHLVGCLLFHADEAFWAGDKTLEGHLKSLITAPTVVIEKKNIDPIVLPNYARFLICSNNEWVVPASARARRWFVLDVKATKIQNSEYFAQITAEMEGGGPSALLGHLLKMDLNKLDLRTVPQTAALDDQKRATWLPATRFWAECLEDGRTGLKDTIVNDRGDRQEFEREWGTSLQIGELHKVFQDWCRRAGLIHHIPGRDQFCKQWRAMLGGLRPTRPADGAKRQRVYVLPAIEQCQELFDSHTGTNGDWDNADAD